MIFYSEREFNALSESQKLEYQKNLTNFKNQKGFIAEFVLSESSLVKPTFQECLDAAKEFISNSSIKYEIIHIFNQGKIVHTLFYRNYTEKKFSNSRFSTYKEDID